ncbi:MAG: sigma 54-interacting transcriptional regulator, partial [Acidobacteriota bacterium]
MYDRETETYSALSDEIGALDARGVTLTVLAHTDWRWVGRRVFLTVSEKLVRLGRSEPVFAHPGVRRAIPLGCSRISRSPLLLRVDSDGILVDARETPTRIEVDGELLRGMRTVSRAQLEGGVVLLLARSVALCLHVADPQADATDSRSGMIGASDAIVRLRTELRRLAPLDIPVLLRGETGTGKELAARALHDQSDRSGRPFVAVNMAAIPPSLAAAELFGVTKGAFTGASRDRQGAFRRADGGTLFLDEIGDTPAEAQALLLRTLETREVLPIGSERTTRVDVRLVSATDLDLESAIDSGRFRSPLVHRIAGFEVRLPALRERREDFGRLLYHFLEIERETLGASFARTERRPWPPPAMVAELALRPWPGNVRQLRNAARQLMILGPDVPSTRLARWLDTAGRGGQAAEPQVKPERQRARLEEISDEQLRGA